MTLAIIAGRGALVPHLLAAAGEAQVWEMAGSPSGIEGARRFRIEELAELIATLRGEGVTEVCFAGGVSRPPVDPAAVTPASAPLVMRLVPAAQGGDDALLREVAAIFEEGGLTLRGAHEIAPDLLPREGVLTRAQPGDRDRRDLARARQAHAALAAADIGQAVVVAAGQALALEALPGTDAMLAALAAQRGRLPLPEGGLLWKAPKPGQDRRFDLPAVGPQTVTAAAKAGLSGIAVEAGGVLLLGGDLTVAAADAAGLWLWSVPPDAAPDRA